MDIIRGAIARHPSFRDEFLTNPSINPLSSREIKFGADTYNNLVAVCGQPTEDIIIRSFAKSKRYPMLFNSSSTRTCITNIFEIAFTGNVDVDKLILLNLDSTAINNVIVNKYIVNILSDNNFWRTRLEQKLGLTSDNPNLDYKFITKYLDNKKSPEYNFQVAIEMNYPEIVKILMDNKVVNPIKPIGGTYTTISICSIFDIDYFHMALNSGNIEIIKILLDDPRINEDTIKFNPISTALSNNNDLEIFKLLLDSDKFLLSDFPLNYAVDNHKLSRIKLLVKNPKQKLKQIFESLLNLLSKPNKRNKRNKHSKPNTPNKTNMEMIKIILMSMKERNDIHVDDIFILLKLFEDKQYTQLKSHIESLI